MALSTAHQQDEHAPAGLREALSKWASLPGSSDALVARMALANVGRNMGTEEVAERLDVAPAAVAKVAGVAPEVLCLGVTTTVHDGRVGTDVKGCSDCAEIIRFEARICRFCGHEFWTLPLGDGSASPTGA